MESKTPEMSRAFYHSEIRSEGRLFIQSSCKHCGQVKIVSEFDHSLQKWEEDHHCQHSEAKAS